MEMTLNIRNEAIILRLGKQKDSIVFVRKPIAGKEIYYNDGVKDFVMTIVEKTGITEGEEYTYILEANAEGGSMKTTTYYCLKEK